jgi:hypothetical protein
MRRTTRHPQVQMDGFTCDEEIADLIGLLNERGIRTVNSCQDNRGRQGWNARRVWVAIHIDGLDRLLPLLSRPAELADTESLSNRIAPARLPRDSGEWERNRRWHYDVNTNHLPEGRLLRTAISIRFPYTDLDEVVQRLQE